MERIAKAQSQKIIPVFVIPVSKVKSLLVKNLFGCVGVLYKPGKVIFAHIYFVQKVSKGGFKTKFHRQYKSFLQFVFYSKSKGNNWCSQGISTCIRVSRIGLPVSGEKHVSQ